MSAAVGTNTEKIDIVAQQVAELRRASRVVTWMLGIGLPLIATLLSFLVYQVFSLTSEVRVLGDRVVRLEGQVADLKGQVVDLKDRVVRLEGQVADLKDRVVRLEGQVADLKDRVSRVDVRPAKP